MSLAAKAALLRYGMHGRGSPMMASGGWSAATAWHMASAVRRPFGSTGRLAEQNAPRQFTPGVMLLPPTSTLRSCGKSRGVARLVNVTHESRSGQDTLIVSQPLADFSLPGLLGAAACLPAVPPRDQQLRNRTPTLPHLAD